MMSEIFYIYVISISRIIIVIYYYI